jgi:hypothetical protein
MTRTTTAAPHPDANPPADAPSSYHDVYGFLDDATVLDDVVAALGDRVRSA